MYRILLLLYLCFLPFLSVNAQTEVNTNIERNTTWTKAGSPYNIAGSIQINRSAILDIEPGVEVNFLSQGEIFVEGVMRGQGNAGNKIIFNGNQSLTDEPNREYIVLIGTGRFLLNHAEVKDFIIFLGVDNKLTEIVLNNCRFVNNVISLFGRDGIITATDCQFITNTSFAIAQSEVNIEKCIFESCGKGLNKVNGTIKNSFFQKNTIAIDGASNLSLQDNLFIENTSTAVRITGNTKPTTILRNKFDKNQDGIDFKGRYVPNLIVEDNNFDNNRYNIITYTDSLFDLKNNCWGNLDPIAASKKNSTTTNGTINVIPFAEKCRPCVSYAGSDTSVCAGDSVKIGGQMLPGYSYQWFSESGPTGSNQSIQFVKASRDSLISYAIRYIITSSSPFVACSADTVTLTLLNKDNRQCRSCIAHAGPDIEVCGSRDTLLGIALNNTFLTHTWQPSEDLLVSGATARLTAINNTSTPIKKRFILKSQDKEAGCTSSDTVIVTIHPRYSNNCESFPSIHIYNVLTPNSDQDNEVFFIDNINLYPQNKVTVYNRWGEEVFQQSNYNNTWSGGALPEGVYYYMVNILENGQKFTGELYIKK